MSFTLHLSIAPAFSFPIPNARLSTSSNRSFLQQYPARTSLRLLQTPKNRESSVTTLSKAKCTPSLLFLSMKSAFGTQHKRNEGDVALLVVDHGSKRSKANAMLEEVTQALEERASIPVYFAHMELATPTIAEGMQQCVQNGAKHVIVVPFFLSPGRHVTSDIPQLTAEAADNFPDVTYEVRPPIGTHPGIIDLILDRAGLPSSKS